MKARTVAQSLIGVKGRIAGRWASNVTCKTSGSLGNIEDWLDDNCQSGWKVVLQRIDKDMVRKHLMVMFETEADKDTFLDKYLKKAE